MKKQTLNPQSKPTQSNELVYFLVSLCLFVITALLASDGNGFFR